MGKKSGEFVIGGGDKPIGVSADIGGKTAPIGIDADVAVGGTGDFPVDLQTTMTLQGGEKPVAVETSMVLSGGEKAIGLDVDLDVDADVDADVTLGGGEKPVALDIKPLAVDTCMTLKLAPFPPTCVQQPYEHCINFTVFGVPVFGVKLKGENRVMIDNLRKSPMVVPSEQALDKHKDHGKGGKHKQGGHAGGGGHGPVHVEPGGVTIRLGH
jgi:hypothetical protein